MILNNEADPNIQIQSTGMTALHFAVYERAHEVAQMIVASGRANQSLQDIYGRTPVDWSEPSEISLFNLDPDNKTSSSSQEAKTTITVLKLAESVLRAITIDSKKTR